MDSIQFRFRVNKATNEKSEGNDDGWRKSSLLIFDLKSKRSLIYLDAEAGNFSKLRVYDMFTSIFSPDKCSASPEDDSKSFI